MSDYQWLWWYANAEETDRYEGPFATREAAVQAGLANAADNDWIQLYVLESRRVRILKDDFFRADKVIEQFNEWNKELIHNDADSAIKSATPQQNADLEAMLSATWQEWCTRHGLGWAVLADIRNEEIIDVPEASAP